MGFSQTGLDAAVADALASFTAEFPGAVTADVKTAFLKGYTRGMKYGMPLDHTTLTALVAIVGTTSKFTGAVALQETATAATSKQSTDNTAITAEQTADTAAVTAANSAISSYAP